MALFSVQLQAPVLSLEHDGTIEGSKLFVYQKFRQAVSADVISQARPINRLVPSIWELREFDEERGVLQMVDPSLALGGVQTLTVVSFWLLCDALDIAKFLTLVCTQPLAAKLTRRLI
ncbi:hypothetical protein EC957_004426 [Mortierella hygrophila]|uniref:Uncharacterized protein n=1 Tax=Mortierella hygrophila TaxID=979708 RepID=A0A9P6K0D7_9FUNG|nr:hypothetical protein EC957_004426 [Mortierella hygrophila]